MQRTLYSFAQEVVAMVQNSYQFWDRWEESIHIMRDLLIATHSMPRIYWRKETKAHPSCESTGAGAPMHHEGMVSKRALVDRGISLKARFELCSYLHLITFDMLRQL
jgi:hypothetical protein